MPFEYEVLVGYLYVVGGRSISAPPPGTLVEVASRRVARGRELDTFFTLVLPSGETVAPAAFYEQMARTGADQYFNSTGSVTAGMKTAFTHLSENLYEHNSSDPRHYEASMVCAVLRGSDLYVGKVGSGVGLFRHNGETQPFPTDFSYREALNTPPLGVQREPEIRMGRYQVNAGTRLLISDATLLDLPMDTLTASLGMEDIGALLAEMREHAHRQITAMAVEFVPPSAEVNLPVKVGESSAVITGQAPPPPPADAPASADAPGGVRRSARRGTLLRTIGGRLAGLVAGLLDLIVRLIDRLIPTPPEGKKSWLSSPIAAAFALLVPVIIVVLVVLFWISGTGESEFDQCMNRATTTFETAKNIASGDVSGREAAWNAVLAVALECDQLKPTDTTIDSMQAEAQAQLDQMQLVSRRTITPIYTFPASSLLTQAILQGEDMYVLDSANQQVYRVTLTTDGWGVVPGSYTPIPAMRRSGKVINYDVGDLIDIAWADNGAGVSQSNVIVALDKNGVLIACPPRFLQECNAQQLQGTELWKKPVAIQFWEGRIYILDPEANQIWRYDPSSGSFSGNPREYFSGSNRPDITSVIDFSITSSGDVFLLTNTGVLARFTSGAQQDFAFSAFEQQKMSSPTAMYMNTNPIAQGFYFAEREQRTIFETTMAGTFVNAYRAERDDFFALLSNVVADTNQGIVYALSGNSILAFRRLE